MNDLLQRLERDFTEQLAGTSPPVQFPPQPQPPMPVPVWPKQEGHEL